MPKTCEMVADHSPLSMKDLYREIDEVSGDIPQNRIREVRRCADEFGLRGAKTAAERWEVSRSKWADYAGQLVNPTESESFITRSMRLDLRGHTDEALDLLYDSVDSLMKNGKFDRLDEVIRRHRAHTLSTDLILGVLTSTLPARSRLPSRARFLREAKESVEASGESAPSLFVGLD